MKPTIFRPATISPQILYQRKVLKCMHINQADAPLNKHVFVINYMVVARINEVKRLNISDERRHQFSRTGHHPFWQMTESKSLYSKTAIELYQCFKRILPNSAKHNLYITGNDCTATYVISPKYCGTKYCRRSWVTTKSLITCLVNCR